MLSAIPSPYAEFFIPIYVIVLLITIVQILLETHSTSKTLAYLLLVLAVPALGIFFFYSFGINYRHRRTSGRRRRSEYQLLNSIKKNTTDNTEELLRDQVELAPHADLIRFIYNLGYEGLAPNDYQLLINGEEKFPVVLQELQKAQHFIHMEYYAWENDTRGNEIKEVLLKKASEGVKIRVMYDDYASGEIKSNIAKELRKAGVEIHPVIRVRFKQLANRLNHRDHRKIIIIDGKYGFVGGINISDRYDNTIDTGMYWRDTHVKITGQTVNNLQRHFLVNWNICQSKPLLFDPALFPSQNGSVHAPQEYSQIVAGGPVSPFSNIMLTYFKIFTSAQQKLYITNPYFIPNDSILNALKQAALSGIDVRLLLPDKSDSAIVGAACRFFFDELLQSGVRIYLYQQGFVHAKTVVADGNLSVVGTANMDIRSFELNFEIMSVIYGKRFASELEQAFFNDLQESGEVTYDDWQKKSLINRLKYAVARLISSFL